MTTFRVLLISSLFVTPAAYAQVKAHASIGFATHDRVFNNDAERVDAGRVDAGAGATSLTTTDVSIMLGASYDVFKGVYVGADVNIVHRNVTSTSGTVDTLKKRFDIRELHINAGYALDTDVFKLDLGLGFKVDLGKQEDLRATEIAVSDGHHAFKAHIRGLANLGTVSLGARVDVVLPFSREQSQNVNGVLSSFNAERGAVVDPALIVKFGVGIVTFGLDVGVLYHAEDARSGIAVEDSNFYVLHAIPSVGLNFEGHELTFALGFQDEDYMLGIPLTGKNHKAPEIPPMSLAWKGSF
ncbi:MAG: hypothetical protein ACI9OJ_001009 [Myxococcota bacterium]|jgi:hypothetical protein